MQKKRFVKQYITFLVGLFIVSFGIAFVTKAALGISPISAIPYSLSLIWPRLSLGNWTILYSLLLITLQVVLLRKNANKLEIVLQVVVSFVFGYFIDFSSWILSGFAPKLYIGRMISLLIGCAIIAFGIFLQVAAELVLVPGDAFVRAAARVTGKEFGTVKVISDSTMSIVAAILCIVFLHELSGVREGTIIAALLMGNIIKLYTRIFKKLVNWLKA